MMDFMNAELSFEDHVRYFSSHLCRTYGLSLENPSRSGGTVALANEEVRLRFNPGDVRDAFIHVYVQYEDPAVLGLPHKSFELRRYIDYCDARDLFPNRYPPEDLEFPSATHLGLNKDYCYIGSPFLIQEMMNFLMVHGDPILRVERKKIAAFIEWVDEKDREYNRRASRPRE